MQRQPIPPFTFSPTNTTQQFHTKPFTFSPKYNVELKTSNFQFAKKERKSKEKYKRDYIKRITEKQKRKAEKQISPLKTKKDSRIDSLNSELEPFYQRTCIVGMRKTKLNESDEITTIPVTFSEEESQHLKNTFAVPSLKDIPDARKLRIGSNRIVNINGDGKIELNNEILSLQQYLDEIREKSISKVRIKDSNNEIRSLEVEFSKIRCERAKEACIIIEKHLQELGVPYLEVSARMQRKEFEISFKQNTFFGSVPVSNLMFQFPHFDEFKFTIVEIRKQVNEHICDKKINGNLEIVGTPGLILVGEDNSHFVLTSGHVVSNQNTNDSNGNTVVLQKIHYQLELPAFVHENLDIGIVKIKDYNCQCTGTTIPEYNLVYDEINVFKFGATTSLTTGNGIWSETATESYLTVDSRDKTNLFTKKGDSGAVYNTLVGDQLIRCVPLAIHEKGEIVNSNIHGVVKRSRAIPLKCIEDLKEYKLCEQGNNLLFISPDVEELREDADVWTSSDDD